MHADPAGGMAVRAVAADGEPMLPAPYRVISRRPETRDCVTLRLEPAGPAVLPPFGPGQFTMLCRPGVGEIAISVSGDPAAADGSLTQTIRDVGAVSRALHQVRGPGRRPRAVRHRLGPGRRRRP